MMEWFTFALQKRFSPQAIMDRIQKLKTKLQGPLPGFDAHRKLAPYKARLDYQIPPDVHIAAVLILLFYKGDRLYFPLITRQSFSDRDKHKGQIALPGGRKELQDPDTRATAIRECAEEIGIASDQVELIGALSPLYIPVSRHHVYPYVGIYHSDPVFNLQSEEIEAVHEVDLDDLLIGDHRQLQELELADGRAMTVPTIQIGPLKIWGATGMILEEFTELIAP
ncbi:MAG TPA: CoA pyrophosphatase [Saprospiraceae bacterium]|nr:CoA pyrophosphatase [Saprospiraceae bacterium]